MKTKWYSKLLKSDFKSFGTNKTSMNSWKIWKKVWSNFNPWKTFLNWFETYHSSESPLSNLSASDTTEFGLGKGVSKSWVGSENDFPTTVIALVSSFRGVL